jgi:hypothetical protein
MKPAKATLGLAVLLAARVAATPARMSTMMPGSMKRVFRLAPLLGTLLLGACMTLPSGPSVLVLPGTGKGFDQFRADDYECRQYAGLQVGGTTANQAAEDSVARSAALGTVVGAVAGAAIGGQRGAGVGAGTGLAVGAMAGTGAGNTSAYVLQQRYDFAFQQCMYAKGHKIPLSGYIEPMRLSAPPAYLPPPPVDQAPPLQR